MILCVITTCERPLWLTRVLGDVFRNAPEDLHVWVYQDGCASDYHRAMGMLCDHLPEGRRWWYKFTDRYARERHHELVGYINRKIATEGLRARFIVRLQDDVRLCRDFFAQAESLWNRIEDPRKAALNIMRDRRYATGCWTGIRAMPEGPVLRTGWIDGLFVSDISYYLNPEVSFPKVPEGWSHAGSGTYAYISSHLLKQGKRLYGVRESLVVHAGVRHSVMHGERRSSKHLPEDHFIDGPEAARSLCREMLED